MNRTLRILCALFVLASLQILASCGKKEDVKPAENIESKVDSALGSIPAVTEAAPAAADTAAAPAPASGGGAGEKLFKSTSLGKVKSSCATCHSTGGSDSRIKAGHTLAGVTKRTSTWGGMYKGADLEKNAYGGNLCATLFQDKKGGLKPDEVASINEYLKSLEAAPGAMTKNLTIQWAAKPPLKAEESVDDKIAKPILKAIMKTPGDVAAGEKVFAKACATCHSFKEKVVGPKFTADIAAEAEIVVGAIRFGYNAMPFFAKDKLTDQQVADVVAYIQATAGN
jgi:mono/diheme cytochrome c family protein